LRFGVGSYKADGGSELPVKETIRLALVETEKVLGNTPAVCRSSYVCPSILDQFEKGKVVPRYFAAVDELMAYRGAALHPAETALLQFLKGRAGHNVSTTTNKARP
jgi:DNA topoisomerase IB